MQWPDWSGRTAVIIGTGPSAATQSLEGARGRNTKVIAIKSMWRRAPWADVLYGCDRGWWFDQDGVPEFRRMKVTASPLAAGQFPKVRLVSLVKGAKVLMGETGCLGCGSRLGGGHSGFHALNLAVQLGARRIVMIGLDLDQPRMKDWREEMDGAASQFSALGVEVINGAPASALKAFPKMPLNEALP